MNQPHKLNLTKKAGTKRHDCGKKMQDNRKKGRWTDQKIKIKKDRQNK